MNCVVMLIFNISTLKASAEKSGRNGMNWLAFSRKRYVTKSEELGARIIESKILGTRMNPAIAKTKTAMIIRINVQRNSSRWSQKDISFSFMQPTDYNLISGLIHPVLWINLESIRFYTKWKRDY